MKRVERVGYMQAIYDTSEGGGTGINDGMSYLTPTTDGGGGGGVYVEPTPVYYNVDPIVLPPAPTDEAVFTSEPTPTPTDQIPVYVDPGGNPIDYVPTTDVLTDSGVQPQLIPATDVQAVIDPGTATTQQTPTPATTTGGNKIFEWIKANPLPAGGIALGLILLFSDQKKKRKTA